MSPDRFPFTKGDRVRRRPGGPVMTVVHVYESLYLFRVRCAWTDGGKVRSDLFRVDDLEPATDPPAD